MKLLNSPMTKLFYCLFIILLIISLGVNKKIAHADAAPPPNPELGGLFPFQETEVQMMYERVEMELELFKSEYVANKDGNRIIVNAYFLMKNQGEADESMQVVFPLSTSPFCFGTTSDTSGDSFTYYEIDNETFQVAVDGVSLPVSIINTKYNICDNYPWAAFDVQFPVGKEVLIKVTYTMESLALDSIQVLDYVLLTGAGWKGPIGSGYIIMKFPYALTSDAILSDSTPGYQILHNEVFWSFSNLEPTVEDNIHLSFVSPDTWKDVEDSRHIIENNPASPDAWLNLVGKYINISTMRAGTVVRDEGYYAKIEPAFQQAIYLNPNNAELQARYAQFLLYRASPNLYSKISNESSIQILSLLNKALSLDPNNQTANQTVKDLMQVAPNLTFTPPVSIPSLATPIKTPTPSIVLTLLASTPLTSTPFIVNTVTTTPDFLISTSTTQNTNLQKSDTSSKSTTTITIGFLFVFLTGIFAGMFLAKRRH